MNTILNLARKWRSKNFDQIVGQTLPVRMLKNSLYRDHYFPVYLFSGQRGCGKTSTARIFAAALNCEELANFQQSPKNSAVPCLTCRSCIAMIRGDHPDFVEIDAASHTGVDNVRQIIDAASLLPLMGRKKIYLIDESHMLSRAAFNAFLKILEEPPDSVLFILATTDPEKIIETVRSRCFQLFFSAIESTALIEHLKSICIHESIRFDKNALEIIVRETQGSARDALNLLEQVRFSSSVVSKKSVHDVLGYVDDEQIIELCSYIFEGSPARLFSFLQEKKLSSYSAPFMWKKLVDLIKAALWVKHGIDAKYFFDHADSIKEMLKKISWQRINQMLEFLYEHEQSFLKTTAQYSFFEMVILQLCQKNKDYNSGSTPACQLSSSSSATALPDDQDDEEDEEVDDEGSVEEGALQRQKKSSSLWKQFLTKLESLNDPILTSLFDQAVLTVNQENEYVITFPTQKQFFQDMICEATAQWHSAFYALFGRHAQIKTAFKDHEEKLVDSTAVEAQYNTQKKSAQPVQRVLQETKSRFSSGSSVPQQTGKKIDVSDKEKWEKTALLLTYFPGTVTEVTQEVSNL